MIEIFAVFDAKAAAYGSPMFVPTRGLALRSFSDVVADKGSMLAKHPGDYSLYQLGTYDPNSGKLVALSEPDFVVSASDMVQQFAASGSDLSRGTPDIVREMRDKVKG